MSEISRVSDVEDWQQNNPFNENDWRQRLFNGLVELFKPTYQLRAVDGVEISIDELVHAWSANNATAEPPPNLQYQLRLQRNVCPD